MNEYFDSMYTEDYLEHHGIVGMHWGIRRFQNEDGSLTSAGKSRYKTGTGKAKKAAAHLAKEKVKKVTKDAIKEARSKLKLKKKEEKAEAKAEKKAEDLEARKAKAIANGDIDTILKLRGSMTTAELRDAANRQIAIKQLRDNQIPKGKGKLEKITDALNTGKKAIDSITGMHKSISDLKKELGFGKKKDDKAQNQNAQQNQKKEGQKNQSSDNLDQRMAEFTKRMEAKLSSIAQQPKKETPKQEKEPKGDSKKGIDLWENNKDPLKNGVFSGLWSSPNMSKSSGDSKINVSSILKSDAHRNTVGLSTLKRAFEEKTVSSKNESTPRILPKVNKIFSDSSSDYKNTKPTKPFSNNASNLLGAARDTAISKIEERNKSGWTAKNNDEWLSVLSTASTMKLTDGEWNKYNKYK